MKVVIGKRVGTIKAKKRAEIIKLDISNQELEGDLELEGFANLEILNCEENKLTSLKIVGSPKLQILSCTNNKLTNLDISACHNLESLWCYGNLLIALDLSLNISDNNFPSTQDLSFLSVWSI